MLHTNYILEIYSKRVRWTLWTHPDGDRERDRDLDGLLDPELREGLRETLRDLPPTLPASLAPARSHDVYFRVTHVTFWLTLASGRREIITFRIRHIGVTRMCRTVRTETGNAVNVEECCGSMGAIASDSRYVK